jgi:hypothetical protein
MEEEESSILDYRNRKYDPLNDDFLFNSGRDWRKNSIYSSQAPSSLWASAGSSLWSTSTSSLWGPSGQSLWAGDKVPVKPADTFKAPVAVTKLAPVTATVTPIQQVKKKKKKVFGTSVLDKAVADVASYLKKQKM